MFPIELIGVSGPALSPAQQDLVDSCVAVAVSSRHRPLVEGSNRHILAITPLAAMIPQVREVLREGKVAILASGDPLFYGIGRTLIDHFGPDRINVHPSLSAVQLACARFRVSWDDLHLVSLHGRAAEDIPGRVLRRPKVMLFTDQTNSPDRISAVLLQALKECEDEERIAAIRIRVGENLGLDDERLREGSLSEIAAGRFSPLNMMLIEQPTISAPVPLGLTEADIRHSRGLITKDEVRAAALHRLRLPAEGVLWDIGGGSGSVSLEAARLCPGLSIYTVEKKPEEQANISANIRRFGTYNIHLIKGEAPEALEGLPAPHRIFIGGSGQRLPEVILKWGACPVDRRRVHRSQRRP